MIVVKEKSAPFFVTLKALEIEVTSDLKRIDRPPRRQSHVRLKQAKRGKRV